MGLLAVFVEEGRRELSEECEECGCGRISPAVAHAGPGLAIGLRSDYFARTSGE